MAEIDAAYNAAADFARSRQDADLEYEVRGAWVQVGDAEAVADLGRRLEAAGYDASPFLPES
jgi:hypothetical protein